MAQRLSLFVIISALVSLISACSEPAKTGDPQARRSSSASEMYLDEPIHDQPSSITVQHCLIGFKGSTTKPVERSRAEAKELAEKLFSQAKDGADFDELVKEYTDDSYPGIYKMVNKGLQGNRDPTKDPSEWVHERDGMVAAFGDVGFNLEVGEIGMSVHDPTKSPYGYHIIKRLK